MDADARSASEQPRKYLFRPIDFLAIHNGPNQLLSAKVDPESPAVSATVAQQLKLQYVRTQLKA